MRSYVSHHLPAESLASSEPAGGSTSAVAGQVDGRVRKVLEEYFDID